MINPLNWRFFNTLKAGIIVKEFTEASATKHHERWMIYILVPHDSFQY